MKISAALLVALSLLGASSSRAQSEPTLAQLFDQYRHGDADAAIEAFANWPWQRLEAETEDNPAPGDPWSDAAFAMFHTEAGFRNLHFYVQRPNHVGEFVNAKGVHFRTSYRLMDQIAAVAKSRGDRRLLDVVKWWCVVVGSRDARMNWQREITQLFPLMQRHLAGDPQIALFAAALLGSSMGPFAEELPGFHFYAPDVRKVRTSSHGIFDFQDVVDIERDLRFALEQEPSLVEARLRLGRVLYLMDSPAAAARELEQTLRDARRDQLTFEGYLAGMFLGKTYEETGRHAAALAAYTEASTFFPRAPAARLARGTLLVTDGRPDEGWSDIRAMFDTGSSEMPVDPWVFYPSAQWWRTPDLLKFLRAEVRGERAVVAAGADAPPRPVSVEPARSLPPSQVGTVETAIQPRTFRASVDGVRIDVFVGDDGRPVTGLTPDAFEIRDNGVRQVVESAFVVGSLSVSLVLDGSSSVGPGFSERRMTSRGSLIKGGLAVASALQPTDVISVLAFDERLDLRVRETRDPAVVRRAVEEFSPMPELARTVAWDAVIAGTSLAVGREGRPVVVMIGDRADNASWLIQSPVQRKPSAERLRLMNLLVRSGVALNIVTWPFVQWGTMDLHVGSLPGEEVTKPTGGIFLDVSGEDVSARIQDHFADLRASYVLTFRPTGVKKDDGWHKVSVQLRKGKGKVVAARPGYYASEVKPKAGK